MLDQTKTENAVCSVICGVFAIVCGFIALLTNISLFAGIAVGTGIWALVYGLMAIFKED